jgi:DNA (cytosine-5)-methyltransferase 1
MRDETSVHEHRGAGSFGQEKTPGMIYSHNSSNYSEKNPIKTTANNVRQPKHGLPLFADEIASEKELEIDNFPFTFIDLFAGIGGFRFGLEQIGGECKFTSERDKFCQQTYQKWFGDEPCGDINEIAIPDIPDHDLLAAGFPCQPFSLAGVSKKQSLGMAHGFECERQGNLFFRICEIAAEKNTPVLFLENVKNLKSHDGKKTWMIIQSKLRDLGYAVFDKIIDASHWVPQHRERIFIVCLNKKVFGANPNFNFPEPPAGRTPKLSDILEPDPDEKYTLTRHLWSYLKNYKKKHEAKGNGFGYGLNEDLSGITRTLSARYHKDGSEILISRGKRKNPRRLTIVEAARLMGYSELVSDRSSIPVSDTQAYRQFGNAVVPAVVAAVGRQLLPLLKDRKV